MKNLIKVFGIIAIIAIIGFLAACSDGDGGGTPTHIHQWGEWIETTPAGYNTAGVETRTCKLDSSHKETRYILALNGTTTDPLGDLLASLPENTTATPYTIKLTMAYFVNHTTMASEASQLINNPKKYVYLDLSDSTFTSIRNNAFENCTSLVSITLPNSVNSIGQYAFNGCTNLTSVNIPNSVTSIGQYTFNGCTSLKNVNIPNKVTTISPYAFSNCTSLTSITIPNSITTQIGPQAFQNCTSLTRVRFEKADTTFAAGAFIDAANTTSLQTAYTAGGIGTYTRPNTSSTTWTKVSN